MQKPNWRWLALLGLFGALIAGSAFRLMWGEDIEFKGDEAFSLEYAKNWHPGEAMPSLGMRSSAGFKNPGLSVWAFQVLGYLGGVMDAPGLARCVQVCSILALFAYVPFIAFCVEPEERETWYWGLALMALNPLAIILHRKIWPPSLFPLMTLAMLLGWWRKDRIWGAFLWGFVGALLGQLQMAGFFLAAAFFVWALIWDRGRVHWTAWVAGSVLGTLPMIPWIYEMIAVRDFEPPNRGPSLYYLFEGMIWIRWLIQPFGLETVYPSLKADFFDFLRYPLINQTPTFGVLIIHVVLIALALWTLLRTAKKAWRQRGMIWANLTSNQSPTRSTLNAAFWGFGILFSATLRPFRYHYGVVAMPLCFVWAARNLLDLSSRARTILTVVCLGNAAISALFLAYIHTNPRPIRGDYGTPYRAQVTHNPSITPQWAHHESDLQ